MAKKQRQVAKLVYLVGATDNMIQYVLQNIAYEYDITIVPMSFKTAEQNSRGVFIIDLDKGSEWVNAFMRGHTMANVIAISNTPFFLRMVTGKTSRRKMLGYQGPDYIGLGEALKRAFE